MVVMVHFTHIIPSMKIGLKNKKKKNDKGELDYYDIGCDGDGFHYDVLMVPDECTLESLGIRSDCAK